LDGAAEPVCSRGGEEIFYPSDSELWAATLELGAEPRVLTRRSLFDVSDYDVALPHANCDVSPDGEWFVFARRRPATHIVVLQNVAELARRAALSVGSVP
jgi:hypothetical protein